MQAMTHWLRLTVLATLALALPGCGGCDGRITNSGASQEHCRLISWPL